MKGYDVKTLQWELKILGERNVDGSATTRNQRAHILSLIAQQLWTLGYRDLRVGGLGGRHINRLLKLWESGQLSAGTIKNRMSALRWWAEKTGRGHVVARANDTYGIPRRQYVTNVSKGIALADEALSRIECPYLRLSLTMQRDFGLRKEESMLFRPSYAWDKQRSPGWIHLNPSWTKGKRPRSIPVLTEQQVETLEEVSNFCGRGSLIPSELKLQKQRGRYEYQARKAGLSHLHGLRHAYAQRRFEELAGYACPALGGKRRREMAKGERERDDEVRLEVSEELGHSRVDIMKIYLGT